MFCSHRGGWVKCCRCESIKHITSIFTRGREVTYMPFGKVKTKAHRIPTSLRERLLQRPWAQEAGVPLKLCPGGSVAGSGRATAMLICFVTSLWYVQRVRHQYSPCEKKAHPSLWKLYLSKSNKSSHRHERPRSRGNMKIQQGTASDHFGIGRFFFFKCSTTRIKGSEPFGFEYKITKHILIQTPSFGRIMIHRGDKNRIMLAYLK